MKKALLLLLLLAATGGHLLAQGKARLSPSTRRYLQHLKAQPAATTPRGYVYKKSAAGAVTISALIKVSDLAVAAQSLRAIGAMVGTKAGYVWTVRVPIEKVAAFTQCAGIAYIQLDEPLVHPRMDRARATTRVDSVHRGIGLPMVYSGKDVVVGIIDFGFDYNHPLFFDTLGTRYRVSKVWELNGTGTPPAGYGYGRELADTAAIKAATTDNDEQTHGTAVAGMAIGSGYGSAQNRIWRGMAYDAEAVLVGVRRDSIGDQWMQGGFTDFIDGVSYIFNHATAVAKPAVVNISWGSQSGPHDGTTLFNEACDALSGPGRIIVMSAGNEGREHIHMSKTFTPADTMLRTFLTFAPAHYQRTWVDAWGDTGKVWCADVELYRNGVATSTTASYCLDDNIHSTYLIGTGGDTCYLEFINSTAEFNDKPRSTITVFNKTTDTVRVTLHGTDGSLDVWNEYYYYGYDYGFQSSFSKLGVADAREGDSMMCVSDMGSAQSVLMVGAYVTRANWTDINGNGWAYNASYAPVNKLASFSSRGPLADGRIKPDITAPGLTVATAISSYDTAYTETGSNSDFVRSAWTHPVTARKYYYAEFSGTSAASPAAAGIVALMLQMKPTLTPADCKSVLFQTAIQDVHTGALGTTGNNSWGHGKINAYGAMKMLAQQLGGVAYHSGQTKLDCVLFPNPASGAFVLHYTGSKAAELNVEVYNAVGALVQQRLWTVEAGLNAMTVPAMGLPAGNYLVRVNGRDGAVSIKTAVR